MLTVGDSMRGHSIWKVLQYQEVRKIVYMILYGVLFYIVSRFIKHYFIASMLAFLLNTGFEKWVEKRFPVPNQNTKVKVKTGIRLGRNVLITLFFFVFSWIYPIGSKGWWVMVAVIALFLWMTIQETKKWRGYSSG